jgi:hypothetical protein
MAANVFSFLYAVQLQRYDLLGFSLGCFSRKELSVSSRFGCHIGPVRRRIRRQSRD